MNTNTEAADKALHEVLIEDLLEAQKANTHPVYQGQLLVQAWLMMLEVTNA